jgi:hypothetical protein
MEELERKNQGTESYSIESIPTGGFPTRTFLKAVETPTMTFLLFSIFWPRITGPVQSADCNAQYLNPLDPTIFILLAVTEDAHSSIFAWVSVDPTDASIRALNELIHLFHTPHNQAGDGFQAGSSTSQPLWILCWHQKVRSTQ